MFSLALIILASCIPFVITWITSPEQIFLASDEAKPKEIFRKKTTKNLSKKGKWFIIAIILTWIFAGIQFAQNENDKSLLKTEKDIRDSVITTRISQGVDSNRKVLFNDLSIALAKQNLKFDSVRKKLEELTIGSNQEVLPQVSLCLGDSSIIVREKRVNEIIFGLRICGYNNTAKNVNGNCYVVGARGGKYFLLGKQPIISNETLLSFEDNLAFISAKGTDGINIFFFYVEFEFESLKGKKISEKNVGQYTLANKEAGKANATFRNQVLKFLNKSDN